MNTIKEAGINVDPTVSPSFFSWMAATGVTLQVELFESNSWRKRILVNPCNTIVNNQVD